MNCLLRRGLPVLAAATLAAGAQAQDARAPAAGLSPTGVQFKTENDAYTRSGDKNYTNGLRIAAVFDAGDAIPRPLEDLSRRWLCATDRCKRDYGFAFGHDIFTPADISNPAPQPNDRPWAGWLYVGAIAQGTDLEARIQETIEVDIGLVGPPSSADRVQSTWHRFWGFPQPRGWSNQIPTEPGVVLHYAYKRKLWESKHFDVVPRVHAALGNVYTFLGGGAIVRAGVCPSGYGTDPDPSVIGVERGDANRECGRRARQFGPVNEAYVFAGLDARLVALNVFLDGNHFRSSPGVSRERFVHDAQAGFSVRFLDDWRLSFAVVRRSWEFTSAAGPGAHATFGSLTFGYERSF